MAKQVTKIVKRPSTSRRRVEVSDGVRVIMAGLNPAEKASIEAAFHSLTALRRLPVEAVVESPNGNLYTARVTNDLRLVYRLLPGGPHVIDLLSAGAVRYLVDPRWMVQSAKMRQPKPRKPITAKHTKRAPAGT